MKVYVNSIVPASFMKGPVISTIAINYPHYRPPNRMSLRCIFRPMKDILPNEVLSLYGEMGEILGKYIVIRTNTIGGGTGYFCSLKAVDS